MKYLILFIIFVTLSCAPKYNNSLSKVKKYEINACSKIIKYFEDMRNKKDIDRFIKNNKTIKFKKLDEIQAEDYSENMRTFINRTKIINFKLVYCWSVKHLLDPKNSHGWTKMTTFLVTLKSGKLEITFRFDFINEKEIYFIGEYLF